MENYDIQSFDVILAALRGFSEELHTSMPGQVVAYDPVTQLADIQPMLKKPQFDDQDNRLDPVRFPVLPKVPVRWPQAGGFAFVLPMQAGDWVWIEFSEGGTGEFRTTGQESEPFDIARHTITYPYCSPAAPPDTQAMSDGTVTAGTKLLIGQLGSSNQIVISHGGIALGGPTPADFVALASKVDTQIKAITDFLKVIFPGVGTTALIAPSGGGPVTSSATGPSPSPSGTGSTLVKCG